MDKIVLSLFVIFGIIILSGYIYMIVNYKKYKNLWNNVRNINLKRIYITMIALSFMFGIYLLYFFTTNKNKYPYLLYTGLVLLLLFSSIWAWKPFFYNKIILFFASFGTFLLLINTSLEISNDQSAKKISALFACILLFVQTFVFDFIIWNGI